MFVVLHKTDVFIVKGGSGVEKKVSVRRIKEQKYIYNIFQIKEN